MKAISELIREDSEGKPPKSVSVSATWWHQPALEYYRRRLQIQALREVERNDPTEFSGYDYYVLSGPNDLGASRAGLTEMFWDGEVGVLLARADDGRP